MKPLWDHWPQAFVSGRKGRDVLLLLDFDGTLSPIARTPNRAKLLKGVKASLERLIGRPCVRLAVLSGRALKDVRRRVGITTAYYSGNHGLEIGGPGISFIHPKALLARPDLAALAARARETLAAIPGALVEDKGLSVTLHARRVSKTRRWAFLKAVEKLKTAPPGRRLRWRRGREVWEALPPVDWNKGRAAALLAEHLNGPYSVAVGDDVTDEDLFAAVGGGGLTVRVGNGRATRARFGLDGPKDVGRLLESLEKVLRGGH